MNATLLHPHPIDPPPEQIPSDSPRRPPRWVIALMVAAVVVAGVVIGRASSRTGPGARATMSNATGIAELAVSRSFGQPGDDWYVVDASTVATSVDGNLITAVVAMHLLGREDSGYVDLGVRYFEVRLRETDAGLVVEGHPGEVPAPELDGVSPAPPLSPADAPLASAVDHYLRWMLTGAPGPYEQTRPQPPPFADVTITGMSLPSDREGLVRVDLLATDASGRVAQLTYHLDVVLNHGVWMVSR